MTAKNKPRFGQGIDVDMNYDVSNKYSLRAVHGTAKERPDIWWLQEKHLLQIKKHLCEQEPAALTTWP